MSVFYRYIRKVRRIISHHYALFVMSCIIAVLILLILFPDIFVWLLDFILDCLKFLRNFISKFPKLFSPFFNGEKVSTNKISEVRNNQTLFDYISFLSGLVIAIKNAIVNYSLIVWQKLIMMSKAVVSGLAKALGHVGIFTVFISAYLVTFIACIYFVVGLIKLFAASVVVLLQTVWSLCPGWLKFVLSKIATILGYIGFKVTHQSGGGVNAASKPPTVNVEVQAQIETVPAESQTVLLLTNSETTQTDLSHAEAQTQVNMELVTHHAESQTVLLLTNSETTQTDLSHAEAQTQVNMESVTHHAESQTELNLNSVEVALSDAVEAINHITNQQASALATINRAAQVCGNLVDNNDVVVGSQLAVIDNLRKVEQLQRENLVNTALEISDAVSSTYNLKVELTQLTNCADIAQEAINILTQMNLDGEIEVASNYGRLRSMALTLFSSESYANELINAVESGGRAERLVAMEAFVQYYDKVQQQVQNLFETSTVVLVTPSNSENNSSNATALNSQSSVHNSENAVQAHPLAIGDVFDELSNEDLDLASNLGSLVPADSQGTIVNQRGAANIFSNILEAVANSSAMTTAAEAGAVPLQVVNTTVVSVAQQSIGMAADSGFMVAQLLQPFALLLDGGVRILFYANRDPRIYTYILRGMGRIIRNTANPILERGVNPLAQQRILDSMPSIMQRLNLNL